ncbi:MAG TPA: hypothetical protein VFW33_07725 [Gemmataceae bacterium]|nr:hypothetical protein [Gemmataceae bacterium]
MLTALPAITVSAIFVAYSAARREHQRRDRVLRERVAYMLWCAAHENGPPRRARRKRPGKSGPHKDF